MSSTLRTTKATVATTATTVATRTVRVARQPATQRPDDRREGRELDRPEDVVDMAQREAGQPYAVGVQREEAEQERPASRPTTPLTQAKARAGTGSAGRVGCSMPIRIEGPASRCHGTMSRPAGRFARASALR